MVRHYVKKTERRSWSEDALIAALHAVEEENMSINTASQTFEIPEPTLRRYVKKRIQNETLPSSGGRYKTTFNEVQEKELAAYLTDLNTRAFGLTSAECRKLAYEYAEQNNIKHQFNTTSKTAGKDWLISFMKRQNISLRQPESTSLGRLMGFNKVEVGKFFDLLRNLKEKHNFGPDRIYNMDESGISTVPNRQPKVLSPKGSRRVAKVASGERGKNTTVACAMNAQGSYVPPFIIFPRVRMRSELLNGCPPNTQAIAHQSGWMNTDTFVFYLKHFIKFTHPTKENPVLLIVDNHSSHCSLDAINLCRSNGVIMIGLPPHTTHRLQPLDVGFFGPLKTYYSQACDNFLINNPGKVISDKEIGKLFGEAYLKAATVGIAVKSFEKCGIEPFNPGVFDDADFAPASMSERINPNKVDKINEVGTARREDPSSDDEPLINLVFNPEPKSPTPKSPIPGPSGLQSIKTFKASTSKQNDISFTEIRPLPKYNRPQTENRKRQKASVITSTPNKEDLEQKEKAKNIKVESKKGKYKVKRNVFQASSARKTASKKKETVCPGCGELYSDPPSEDWIQCNKCSSWWHESCTGYEGRGEFNCELCF